MGRRYPNPPVVEALCEIYTDGSAWDPTVPGLFYERVRDRFPKRGQARDVEIEVTVGAPAPATKVTPSEPRSQFAREDGSRMIQVARDLVVVNQLRPYPAFEEWRPQILEALDLYRELAKPSQVSRIGLRYLNRVVVPEPEVPMDRYFQLYPELPKALGTLHGPFMLRIELPTEVPGHQLVVTFGSAPRDREGTQAFVLDLYDVVGSPGFDAVPQRIDEAHAHIERAFEAILTDATRALFQG
jgi:uncharacterized protein (TIGR04255 family)